MFKQKIKVLFAVSVIAAVAGCQNLDDPYAGTKSGAIGGALIGVTAGLLTGDSSLALKAGAMGAVAGGVGGNMKDLENSRENKRNRILSDGIAGNNSNNNSSDTQAAAAPATWDRLNDFTGNWLLDVSALTTENNKVNGKGKVTGSLASTTEAQLQISEVFVEGRSEEFSGVIKIGYTPETSYVMKTTLSMVGSELVYIGEFDQQKNLYTFYPSSTVDGQTFSGEERTNVILEMRFVGKEIIFFDVLTRQNGQYILIQEYKFSRTG